MSSSAPLRIAARRQGTGRKKTRRTSPACVNVRVASQLRTAVPQTFPDSLIALYARRSSWSVGQQFRSCRPSMGSPTKASGGSLGRAGMGATLTAVGLAHLASWRERCTGVAMRGLVHDALDRRKRSPCLENMVISGQAPFPVLRESDAPIGPDRSSCGALVGCAQLCQAHPTGRGTPADQDVCGHGLARRSQAACHSLERFWSSAARGLSILAGMRCGPKTTLTLKDR
jgi:hypothetical protein